MRYRCGVRLQKDTTLGRWKAENPVPWGPQNEVQRPTATVLSTSKAIAAGMAKPLDSSDGAALEYHASRPAPRRTFTHVSRVGDPGEWDGMSRRGVVWQKN